MPSIRFYPPSSCDSFNPPHSPSPVLTPRYDPPTFLCPGNLPWHAVFGVDSGMVDTTICNGRVLMRGRKIQTFNPADIKARARARAPGVWERV